jgi:hypothetical protein
LDIDWIVNNSLPESIKQAKKINSVAEVTQEAFDI